MAGNSDKTIDIADPFARQLMARYLDRRDADIRNLRAALDAAQFDSIATTGHNLYGSGATYGLEKISQLGQSLEQAAKLRETKQLERLIGELEGYLQTLKVR